MLFMLRWKVFFSDWHLIEHIISDWTLHFSLNDLVDFTSLHTLDIWTSISKIKPNISLFKKVNLNDGSWGVWGATTQRTTLVWLWLASLKKQWQYLLISAMSEIYCNCKHPTWEKGDLLLEDGKHINGLHILIAVKPWNTEKNWGVSNQNPKTDKDKWKQSVLQQSDNSYTNLNLFSYQYGQQHAIYLVCVS